MEAPQPVDIEGLMELPSGEERVAQGESPCPKKVSADLPGAGDVFQSVHCSFAGDFQYLAGYCFELSGMLG